MWTDVFPGRFTALRALTAIIIITSASASAQIAPSNPQPDVLRRQVAEALNLIDCELASIDVPVAVRAPLTVEVTIEGRAAQLALSPVSIRAEDFAVYAVRHGRMSREQPRVPHTYRGTIAGRADTAVAATIVNNTLNAIIFDGEQTWSIEPAPAVAGAADPALHAVYMVSDIKPGDWRCGMQFDGPAGPQPRAAAGSRGVTTACASLTEIAIEADFEYFQLNNSLLAETILDIETLMNAVSLLYAFQVGIAYEITEIIVYEDNASDPYNSTTSIDLIQDYADYRTANPYSSSPDVAHLFTGKNISAAEGVIGRGYLGQICNPNLYYAYSESLFTSNFLYRVALTTHELGHNWSARHCDGDFDCGVMCSGLGGCGPADQFGERSVADISAFRDSIDCLDVGVSGFNLAGELLAQPADANLNDNFGTSVDMVDGVAIVGAYADDEAGVNAGAAYILEFDGSQWEQTAKLMPDLKPSPAGDRFGVSVALDVSNTSRSAAVGAYLDTGNANISGSVSIFTKDSEKGWIKTQKLVRDPKKMAGDLFGYDVAISGPYMIVGAPRANNNKGKDSGAVFIYQGGGGTWSLVQMLTAGKDFGGPNDQFGTSVDIDWDPVTGGTAVVGAWMDDCLMNNGGAVYIYRLEPGSSQWEREFVFCRNVADDQFGYSVAVDGDMIAAGAWLNDQIAANAGAVLILRRDPGSGNWSSIQTLTEPDLMANDNYGSAVSMDGDLLAIGAYRSDAHINNGGAVYGYRFIGNQWTPLGAFEPAGLGDNDQLGISVAVSGDYIISGAWMHDDTESNQGAAHIFVTEEEPIDCDANGIPDACDLEFGTAFDCNGNGVLDSCDILDSTETDNDNNGIPDSCDTDCNGNGITDTTEIAAGTVPDCNENGFPDSCDVDPLDPDDNGQISEDVNMDGIPDECSPDCNGNGVLDSIDIATMTSSDCNNNNIPDECDRGEFRVSSGQLGPIGGGMPQSLALNASTAAPPWAVGDVSVRVLASADLDLTGEYINLLIDNTHIKELFRTGALECPADDGLSPDVETTIIPAALWNAALRGDQAVVVRLVPDNSMNAGICATGSWANIEISYTSGDCNSNNILDICETDSGMTPDCNDNGVPDSCELADFDNNLNGIPDDCETCPEDMNGDGAVNVFDLFALLSDWGPCIGCDTDLAGPGGPTPDGEVNVFDLFALLSAWTTTCP